MYVKRLKFENYRNLIDSEIFPCNGINVIYGDNAQGKSNLLESIWLFTGGHSFRGSKDSELQKIDPKTGRNSELSKLELDFYSMERNQKAILNIKKGRRSSVINGVEKKTGSALIGKIIAVVFSPEHLLLIKDGPSKRRSFIDGAICQIKPAYARILAIYNRSLIQRNALLKDIIRHPELKDTLEIWNMRLAKLGSQVISERRSYVEKLSEKIAPVYSGISREKEKIGIEYVSSLKSGITSPDEKEIELEFIKSLLKTENSDIKLGFTTVGPHRDDLEIEINGMSARMYGSQGQQRSAVLSLKLAEAEILSEFSGETPLILLDDVMSELDRSRQDYLLNHLHDRQVFITCCDPEAINLMETGKRIYIENGNVNEK